MVENIKNRLIQLKTEFQTGQKTLADLQNRQNEIQTTLLRISGAIQVLEEELAKETETEPVLDESAVI